MGLFANRRRGFVVVTGGVAGLVACASVAMACIPYKGKMKVEGSGDGATRVEVVGSNAGMSYCPGEPYGPSAVLPNPNGQAKFKVKVKPADGACAGQLVGLHGVRFWSGSPTELGQSDEDFKCFPWNQGSVHVGDLIVDDGHASGEFRIPAGAAPGYGAVCLIAQPINGLGGNRAPILVL